MHTEFALLPKPEKIHVDKSCKSPSLKSLKYIFYSPACENEAKYLAAKLKKEFSLSPEKKTLNTRGSLIVLSNSPVIKEIPDAPRKKEAFSIKTSETKISLAGFDEAGLFYAVQALLQIYRQTATPSAFEIHDSPSLSMRGYHMDLKKGVLEKKHLYSLIDRLSELRLNTLLLEYENRFAYKKHPSLAAPDALSPSDVKDILEYAGQRHIKIIPLLQCLGHVEYVLSNPLYSRFMEIPGEISQYCPSNPETFNLFKSFFDELSELHMDSEFFHIGGDETRFLGKCPRCSKTAGKLGTDALYAGYISKICDYVISKGKKPVIWDDMLTRGGKPELMKKLPPETLIMYWDYRSEEKASSQLLLEGARISKKWHQTIRGPSDFIKAPQSFSGYWEDLDANIRKKYLPYFNAKGFPEHGKVFPYIELIQQEGLEVIGASSLRCGADRVLPRTLDYMSNIITWASRAQKTKIRGVITTSWAAASTFGPPSCALSVCDHLLAASGAFYWNPSSGIEDFNKSYDFISWGMENREFQEILRLTECTENEAYFNWMDTIINQALKLKEKIGNDRQISYKKYLTALNVKLFERKLNSYLRKIEDRFFPGSPAAKQKALIKSAQKQLKMLFTELKELKAKYASSFKNDFSKTTLREAVNAAFALYEARLNTAVTLVKGKRK